MSRRKGRPTRESQEPGLADRAVALYEEHRSIQKVSQILRCGRNTAARMLQDRGVTIHRRCDRDMSYGETIACAGCGLARTVNMSRGYRPYCLDCRPLLGESRQGEGIRCGTIDGFRQHRTFGQTPCKPCRLAVKGIAPQPEPFARCTDCDKLVRTEHAQCALCRRGVAPTEAAEPEPVASLEPVIQWVKDRHGISHGIVHYEPQPDSPHADAVRDEGPAGYDEARVQRRILGDRSIRLHKGEAEEVVRRLLAKDWSANQIRRHTGLQPDRYVLREDMERAA